MLRRSLLSVAATATLLLGAPAAARAAGVTIDPDSPAGREYALPLDTARSGGGGGAARSDRATDDDHEQLFGAGIEDGRGSGENRGDVTRSSGAGSSTSGDRRRKQQRDADAGSASAPAGGSTRTEPAPAVTNRASEATLAAVPRGEGRGPVLAIVGGVLASGLLAGLLLRRRGRRTPG